VDVRMDASERIVHVESAHSGAAISAMLAEERSVIIRLGVKQRSIRGYNGHLSIFICPALCLTGMGIIHQSVALHYGTY